MEPLTGTELVLVLGGQRSGKSERAEELAATGPAPVTYVATAKAGEAAKAGADPELEARLRQHQARRDPSWCTVEAGDHLELPAAGTVILDGLGLWLAGLEDPVEPEWVVERLRRPGPTVVVSDEVGMGVIAPTPEGRRFADALGRINQAVAGAADRAYLVVAGRVLVL